MKFRDLINKTAIKILTPFCRPGSSPGKTLIMFAGHSYNGNLKSLYEEFGRRQTFSGKPFKVYWVAKRRKDLKRFRREKVAVLWYYALFQIPKFLKAGVWLNDQGQASIPVPKRPGALWVQAGHAIPFRSYAGDPEYKRVLKEFDLHPVSSDWFRNYYVKEIKLDPEKVVVTGYPRVDRILKPYYARERIIRQMSFRPDQPIVMYAPTWEQENESGRPLFPFGDDREFLKQLEVFLEQNRMQMMIRLHPKWKGWVPRSARPGQEPDGSGNLKFCSAKVDWDAEKYLYVTDVLITDWSSIANDFLVLDRPIIFIDRPPKFFYYGYTIRPEERPGPTVKTAAEFFSALIQTVSAPNDREYAEKRRVLREKVHFKPDGQASSRTIAAMEKIFHNIGKHSA